MSREIPSIHNPNVLEGTLSYMSPEQTGRMNRSMDYRTDLYSLGVSFYQMLTGQLPFKAKDAMELVHCHIAKMPIPPYEFGIRVQDLGVRGQNSGVSGQDSGFRGQDSGSEVGWNKRSGSTIICPTVLSNIIIKLMAKNAEDRYQGAFGLKADLKRCLDLLVSMDAERPDRHSHAERGNDLVPDPQSPIPESRSLIPDFEIGQQDISNRLQIPQKLYGRENEIKILLSAFDRVADGNIEVTLVAGYAGIGKSTLVHEIHKSVVARRGYFISGKFDQYKKDIPYSALIQAFQKLIRHLLAESQEIVTLWKENLIRALGKNGQVIVDVIPELELLIGRQSPLPQLEPDESRNRFNLTFQNFIRVCTSKDHPLVLFLDDLHWADTASLKMLELFMLAPQKYSLLLIGAYRDNEVDQAHPLPLTLGKIQKGGKVAIQTITLPPLKLESGIQLISETLWNEKEKVISLAELCFKKTRGNPFFLNELLRSLYQDRLIDYDPDQGQWIWDLDRIQSVSITDNVIELMTEKIQKLSSHTFDVLRLASCIGSMFDLKTLALASEKSPSETVSYLEEALQEELVIPTNEAYKFMGQESGIGGQGAGIRDQGAGIRDQGAGIRDQGAGIRDQGAEIGNRESEFGIQDTGQSLNPTYKFVHDRVQQAAYSLVSDSDKPKYHLKIGRLILENCQTSADSTQQVGEHVFDIVNHLNQGRELIEKAKEKEQLARLNLEASQKAKKSAAYKPSLNYLQIGLSLFGSNSWQNQYDLTLALHVEAVEAAYFNAEYVQMDQWGAMVLKMAKTVLDTVSVYEIKIKAFHAQHQLTDAISAGLEILAHLGIHFPQYPTKAHILFNFLKTRWALRGKATDDLLNLPLMSDPHSLGIMRILSNLASVSYFAFPELLPLFVFKGIRLSAQHGNAPVSGFFYNGYALMILAITNDIDYCYAMGHLGLQLSNQLYSRNYQAKTIMAFNVFIRHWKEHGRKMLESFLEGYSIGLETGDLEYAAYHVQVNLSSSLNVGKELTELELKTEQFREWIIQLNQNTVQNLLELNQQYLFNLIHQSKNPCHLTGKHFDEDRGRLVFFESNDRTALSSLFIDKSWLGYLFENYRESLKNAIEMEKYLEGLVGQLSISLFYFVDSLARLALFSEVSKMDQYRFLRKVSRNQKKMKKWAFHAPMNHLHKWKLVEAERARVRGNNKESHGIL